MRTGLSLLTGALLGLITFSCTSHAGSSGSEDPAHALGFRDCAECPEMLIIASGEFEMGSEETTEVIGQERPEGPVHHVTIRRPFALGKTEVTNRQFEAFVKATEYTPSDACSKWRGEVVKFGGDWRDPDYGREPLPEDPVVCVSWFDAKAYVQWLAEKTGKPYRLPSEAEWEYSARGGSKTTWPWGKGAEHVCRHANVFDQEGAATEYAREYVTWSGEPCSDGHGRVAPVGSFEPNPFGLHDMIGNVWEWVEDCSLWLYPESASTEEPVQVKGDCEKRAVRGGSWLTRIDRQRPTFRGRDPEALASHIFGFRVARDVVAAH